MQHYSNLLVWQKSHALAVLVHETTETMVRRDRSAAIVQVRRSALSIPSISLRVAGGRRIASSRDSSTLPFASSNELEYQLEYMTAIRLLSASDSEALRNRVREIRRMLYGLLKKL